MPVSAASAGYPTRLLGGLVA